MSKINLKNISLERFEELMNGLDVILEGENLYIRMWSGGGCYILNDQGDSSQEFSDLGDLVEFLIKREEEIKTNKIVPVIWQ
jgi:hypothetical protein